MIQKSKVRGSLSLVSWYLSFSLAFHHSSSFLSLLPLGSSDEDEDEDGVSAATFLKKKSEAPSGESRKFLKKLEVRDRVTVSGDLPPVDHSWVPGEKKRLTEP